MPLPGGTARRAVSGRVAMTTRPRASLTIKSHGELGRHPPGLCPTFAVTSTRSPPVGLHADRAGRDAHRDAGCHARDRERRRRDWQLRSARPAHDELAAGPDQAPGNFTADAHVVRFAVPVAVRRLESEHVRGGGFPQHSVERRISSFVDPRSSVPPLAPARVSRPAPVIDASRLTVRLKCCSELENASRNDGVQVQAHTGWRWPSPRLSPVAAISEVRLRLPLLRSPAGRPALTSTSVFRSSVHGQRLRSPAASRTAPGAPAVPR